MNTDGEIGTQIGSLEFSSEKLLWANVLWVAVRDAANDGSEFKRNHESNRQRKAHKSALRWFRSQKEMEASFLWVCAALDLDPDRVRRWVKEIVENPERLKKTRAWRSDDEL